VLSKEIDNITFKIKKLDVFDANELDQQILALTPIILDGIDAVQPASGDLMDSNLGGLSEAIRKLFEAMPTETFNQFCVGMLACVTAEINENEIPLTSKEVIGKIGLKVSGLYKLLLAVMEENGFIPFELLASGELIKKTLSSLGVSKVTKKPRKR